MTFGEQLNEYISQLGCTAKELSGISGLSGAVISRYRTGERLPDADSEQVEKLSSGIAALALQKGIPVLTYEMVKAAFSEALGSASADYEKLTTNFNALITVLNISMTELARHLNFDASYLSRIRSGMRRPADLESFVNGVSRFTVSRYTREEERAIIAELIGAEKNQTEEDALCLKLLSEWLSSGASQPHDYMGNFLKKLDEFDLDEYIRAIHFNELKVPTIPFQLPTSKTYYGIEEMKQGELDFFKSTVLSKSTEPVFMCSDMPLEDMAEDVDFGKKWMFAIAMSLKKGLHLNIVHNIDRPFKEMMLGLESWIPIYMTGQVSPYYLKGIQNSVYCHFNYSSGSVALTGECINGFHGNGKYYLTKNKDEVTYYKRKAANLLSKAQPLMDIYRKNNENTYRAFLKADALTEGSRRNILSSLPLYTMSEEMLSDILKRHFVFDIDGKWLFEELQQQKSLFNSILQNNTILDEVVELSKEEFEQYPMSLSLSDAFYENEITYTYEEYREHLRLTKEYAESHTNYSVHLNKGQAFRNIQMIIHEGKWVMISKNKAPVIHFVMRHSKMVDALESFIVPVAE